MSTYYGYPPKCDICGKFHRPESGAAWLQIPACDIPGEFGDERARCARCVTKFGPFHPGPKYRADLVSGVYS
jgi:hypothetical protein